MNFCFVVSESGSISRPYSLEEAQTYASITGGQVIECSFNSCQALNALRESSESSVSVPLTLRTQQTQPLLQT
jgi:hypothetical protein